MSILRNNECANIAFITMHDYHRSGNFSQLMSYAKRIMDEIKEHKNPLLQPEIVISIYMDAYLAYLDAARLQGKQNYVFQCLELDGKYGEPTYKVENVLTDIPENLLKEHQLRVDLFRIMVLMDFGYWHQAYLFLRPLLFTFEEKFYPDRFTNTPSFEELPLLETRIITLNAYIHLKLNNLGEFHRMMNITNDFVNFYVNTQEFQNKQSPYNLMLDILHLEILGMQKQQKSSVEIHTMHTNLLGIFNFNKDLFSSEQSGMFSYLKSLVSMSSTEKVKYLESALNFYQRSNILRNTVIIEYLKNLALHTQEPKKISKATLQESRKEALDLLTYVPQCPEEVENLLTSMLLQRSAYISSYI